MNTKTTSLQLDRSNLLLSLRRTIVPIAVGAVMATFIGPYVDEGVVRDFLGGVLAAVYYATLRLIESRWPAAGILLGASTQPEYVPATPAETRS